MRRARFLWLLLVLPSALGAQTDSAERAAATITATDYHRRVAVLADDSMKGRDTPSPELEEAARWIASEFESFGLTPGADGTFLQRYPIYRLAADFEASHVEAEPGGILRFGPDLLVARFGSLANTDRSGGVVVISGAQDPESAFDGLRLEGRHVVYVPPPGVTNLFRNRATRQVLGTVFSGDPASFLVANDMEDAEWQARVRASENRVSTSLEPPTTDGDEGFPFLEIRDAALARILELREIDLGELRPGEDAPLEVREVADLELTVVARTREISVERAPNVVGVLEGSDPELADEYVVFSAHMDHVGVGSPDASGDSIYNGADDDASGTVAVIEIAEAMAALPTPPRRSMIFLTVSGEEKGLWGSRYFAEHPPVPLDDVVANLNMDMVGRNWSDTIVAIGRKHSDLGETLARVNAAHPELNMTAIDDRWPEQNFYRRSDHFNFARRGVPILFFFNGTHEDYHRPSDEVEKIDADKAARIARLVFYLGLDIGQRTEPPRWDPESYESIVEGGR